MPRISPVWMFIVTKAPRRPLAASAPSPAACTLPSIVSFRLSPGTGRCETSLPAGGRLAEGVDLDPGDAGLAAQVFVVGVLDPFLADRVAGFEALVARLFEVFLGHLADAAEDVGGEGFVRVAAHEDALDVDAGEAAFVLFQVVDEVVADVAAQRHRHAGRQFEFFVHRLAQLRQRGVDQFAELRELGVLPGFVFGQLLRADLEREADPVGDEDVRPRGRGCCRAAR